MGDILNNSLSSEQNPSTFGQVDYVHVNPVTQNSVNSVDYLADPQVDKKNATIDNPNLGYVAGYGLLNSDLTIAVPTRTQTMPTDNDEDFKYGIEQDVTDYMYEDPTVLTYEIILDVDDSPLLNGSFLLTKSKTLLNNAQQFITTYGSTIAEIAGRQDIYDEFVRMLIKIFDTDFAPVRQNKVYYIQRVEGLDKIMSKIPKYKDDKITITLVEDVGMTAMYLAELYNNLAYSYKYQRYIIPENCLRFDMKIKIHDFRTFKVANESFDPNKDDKSKMFLLDQNRSNIIYTLHDCNFEFFNSVNTDTAIEMGGFGSVATTPQSLQFNIYYKSISREMNPNLIDGGMTLSNKRDTIVNNKVTPSDDTFKSQKSNADFVAGVYSTAQMLSNNASKTSLGVIQGLPGFGDKLVNVAEQYLQDYQNKLLQKYREARGTLINEVIFQIPNKLLEIPKIYPDNVYAKDFNALTLQGFSEGLAAQLLTETQNSVQEIANNTLEQLGNSILSGIGLGGG